MELFDTVKKHCKEAAVKTKDFVVEVATTVKKSAIEFAHGFYTHAESIGLLSLASIGMSYLLGEIPFYFALPAVFEAPLVIPVLSVLIVLGLVWLIEIRHSNPAINVA